VKLRFIVSFPPASTKRKGSVVIDLTVVKRSGDALLLIVNFAIMFHTPNIKPEKNRAK